MEIGSDEPSFEVFLDFIRRLLVVNPEQRMSASEAAEHQFIVNKC
jgi:serine/threonine protein kinase